MKQIITNNNQLNNWYKQAEHELKNAKHGVFISISPIKRDKTKNQLGYFFGCIVSDFKEYLIDTGDKLSSEEIKTIFYYHCSPTKIIPFNGEIINHSLTLSQMDKEQASEFIDRCLNYINNEVPDCLLRPVTSHSWTRHIDESYHGLRLITEHQCYQWNDDIPEYRDWIKKQRCCNCGNWESVVHHLRIGELSGVGLKNPDWLAIPICNTCHQKLHQKGELSFYGNMSKMLNNINIRTFAVILHARWRMHLSKV